MSGSAPPVAGPRDLPELRLWLHEEWKPGRAYAMTAAALLGVDPSYRPGGGPVTRQQADNYADWERRSLHASTLWWVSEEMVDVLNAAAESIPADATPGDLPTLSPSGLVVFAKPLEGTDAKRGTPLLIDALVWNTATVLPPTPNHRAPRTALSVSSYRCLDFDAGLGGADLGQAVETGAIELARYAEAKREGNSVSMRVHGTAWAPLGRSDWPVEDRLDTPPWDVNEDQSTSMVEDRRFIAALFTLLAQEGIASRTVERADRPVARRTQRAGIDRDLSDVQVVRLRRPHTEGTGEGSTSGREWAHRWIVDGHWRWQACGPRHSERRLIYVGPYVKGPDDKPLKPRTKVHSWVR